METFQQDYQQVNGPVLSDVKDFPSDERLSLWEMSQLWLIYQANSYIKCILHNVRPWGLRQRRIRLND